MSDLEIQETIYAAEAATLEPTDVPDRDGLAVIESTVRQAVLARERLERRAVEIRQRTAREIASVAAVIAGALTERDRLEREAAEQRATLERMRRERTQVDAAISSGNEQRERLDRQIVEQRERLDRMREEVARAGAAVQRAAATRERLVGRSADLGERRRRDLVAVEDAVRAATTERDHLVRDEGLERERLQKITHDIAKADVALAN